MSGRARFAQHKAASRPARGPLATTVGVTGETLLTAGVLILLYVAYVLWGTGLQTDRAQDDLREETAELWSALPPSGQPVPAAQDPDEIDIGDAYAIIRAPRLGDDWEWYVVQGVERSDLARGPGHYEDTANPGELGNLSIAGHRSGHGAPFADLNEIEAGDTIEVTTATGTWTYTIDYAAEVIEPTDTWVVDPVPGEGPEVSPTERRITLTTCHPRYASTQRLYVSGVLTDGEEV
ncbi:MAG: class E sortase [Jiangellaceae bacterium]